MIVVVNAIMNSASDSATASSWSLPKMRRVRSRKRVRSPATSSVRSSRTTASVIDWKSTISTADPMATQKYDQRMSPMAVPIAFETGTIATTMVNAPIAEQIRATAPIFSRSFWFRLSAGSIDQ